MKIDTHVLFLIVIVGIISAGLVGANVLSSDQSWYHYSYIQKQ